MTTKGTKRQNSICLLEKDGDYNQKQRCRELIMEINKAREKEYVDFTLDYYDVNAGWVERIVQAGLSMHW